MDELSKSLTYEMSKNVIIDNLMKLIKDVEELEALHRDEKKIGKCKTCIKEFATCDSEKIVWGIDIDPSAIGADADKVFECDAYISKEI